MRILLSLFFVHTFLCYTADREIEMTEINPIVPPTPEISEAALQQLPVEIKNYILRYVNFFAKQRHKVYNKTIKPHELVGTIQLACALENYDFLAAVELRRFFHKPELIGSFTENTGILIDLLPPNKYTIVRTMLMKTITTAPLSYKPHYPLKLSSTKAFAPFHYLADQNPILRLSYDQTQKQPTLIIQTEKETAVISLTTVAGPTIYKDPDTPLIEKESRSSQLVYNQKIYCYELPLDIHPDHYVLDLPENDYHGGHNNNRIGSIWDVQGDTIYTVIDHSHTGIDIKIHDLKPYRATTGFHRLLLASIMGFCNIDYTGKAKKRELTENALTAVTQKYLTNHALAKCLIGTIENINDNKARCIQNPTFKKGIDWCFNSTTYTEYEGGKPHMPITVTWVNEPNE